MRLKTYITFWKKKMKFISMKKKNAIIPLIWVPIYLSIVPMQLSNYVLCIGSDGHVEFEIGADGRCTDLHGLYFEIAADGRCTDLHGLYTEHMEVVIAAAASEEDHCGSCIDLAIFASIDLESYLVPIKNASIQSHVFVVAPTTDQTLASTILTHPSRLNTPSVVDPTLISLRTTTLLI